MTVKDLFIDTIKNYKFGKPKQKAITGSMKELICPEANYQSFCIKLGNCIELCFNNYIKSRNAIIIDKTITIDNNKRQADLYFEYNGFTYYFESKNNINLDTEKIIDVNTKVAFAPTDFKGVVAFRFLENDEIPNNLKSKFTKCELCSINRFLSIFNDKMSKEDFNEIISLIRKIYNNY